MSEVHPSNPLIVHADRTVVLETFNELAEAARKAIAPFAELERSPEHLHTYRITPLSLWNATSAGISGDAMVSALRRYSKFPLPSNLEVDVHDLAGRWGRLRLESDGDDLVLCVGAKDEALLLEVVRHDAVTPLLQPPHTPRACRVSLGNRGVLKQVLLGVGWPVQDIAGYLEGVMQPIALNASLKVRPYQLEAVEAFYQGGAASGGSGVIVLPPGSGKTVVGIAAMARIAQRTLVLTTNRTSAVQWRRELLAKTSLGEDEVTEYAPQRRHRIAPITICTYQMLTTRARGGAEGEAPTYPHLSLMRQQDWGLIIYDEVHLLPAPVFRLTAEIQARRRLGLTATLVREDGREADVFSLIGPKRYDRPWRELEQAGYIATADCCEVRLRLPEGERMAYALANPRERYRLATTTAAKDPVVQAILALHPHTPALVIGQYLDQLERLAHTIGAPLITGETPQATRDRLFDAFRAGIERRLVLSKVGNFALDLPDAALLIQVSGAFGSRQEEAQRLGRVLRPKGAGIGASFYTLVARETEEETFAHQRQRFLTEQGYAYRIMDAAEWLAPTPRAVRELN
jgi:DNA excision repair protein ERCC-3